ncbi:unnamed protein product [Eruca vesicaria subsp. sativa]|uniref:Uncharacterized protein n=1 Tax=Eruca vesicaria subsp. sativa TaxID=29727 RepID=A0ABC8K221_ERUVS|nr:unnamed protein product [Eruca vesicaria subsp. sativa]
MLNALRNSNLTLVVLICFVLIASKLCSVNSSVYNPHNILKKQFGKWLQHHGKSYRGKDEWMFRFGIYQSNIQWIDYINSLHMPFKLAENRFADMTNSEFKAHFLGLNTSSLKLDSNPMPANCDPSGNVPAAVDWRKEGAVTPIRNQGRCGGCWAFATVSAIEGINKIKTGNLISLSEQQLIDCDTGSYNKGCSGGLMETAYEYLVANGGLVALEDYPYTATDGTGCDQEKSQNKIVTIKGYQKVAQNEASLEVATAQQPVSVGIDADGFIFQFYSSGVFTGYCGSSLNHAVTVVGYGEEDGEKYWIVKNTWGTGWGEEGYIRMERGYRKETGKCGIAMLASYPLQ